MSSIALRYYFELLESVEERHPRHDVRVHAGLIVNDDLCIRDHVEILFVGRCCSPEFAGHGWRAERRGPRSEPLCAYGAHPRPTQAPPGLRRPPPESFSNRRYPVPHLWRSHEDCCRLRPTGQTPLRPHLSLPAAVPPATADPGTLSACPIVHRTTINAHTALNALEKPQKPLD